MFRAKNKIILVFCLIAFVLFSLGSAYLKPKTIDVWLAYWDTKNSLENLKNNFKNTINGANLFFYSLDPEGNIINALPEPSEYKQIVSTLRQLGIKIIPSFTNDIIYSKNKTILKDPDIVSRVLGDSKSRKKHIEQILNIVNEIDAAGVDIDYEKMHSEDRNMFSQFIKELSELLHNQNKTLAVTVQQKTEDHRRPGAGAIDWKEISYYADQIIIMCYNYSSRVSKPGPICPPFWLKDIIKFAKAQIPPDKICIALGLHGYDWSDQEVVSVNFKKVVELLKQYPALLTWDRKSQSPYFNYSKDGVQHEVWFENQNSLTEKINLLKKYNINQIAIWHLGILNPSFSESLDSFLE